MTRRVSLLLLALTASLAFPSAASADADLVTAEPAAGMTVTELAEVVLTFDEPLNADKSSVVVRTGGQTIAEGGVDPADATRMVAVVTDAAPGAYEVRYTANSQDGHLVRDTYTFTLDAPTPTPTPTASPTAQPTLAASPSATVAPTTAPAASPASSPAPDDPDSSASTADYLLPIVVVAVLLVVGGVSLVRRRS